MKLMIIAIMCCTCLDLTVKAQYTFPGCATPWVAGTSYTQGNQVSYNNANYQAKYYTTTAPGSSGDWAFVSKCGEGGLGPNYGDTQRVIGYLPYWVPDFNLTTFNPETVTNVVVAFNLFRQNNNNFASADFASIAWGVFHKRKVDSVLFDTGVLGRAHAKGVKVSVALGGATDYAFLWLLSQYYNNDAKLEEMATFITSYVAATGIDGIDLDLECWWPDGAISGTVEQGGRVRGDKWGGPDAGPHPACLGLTRLAKKLKAKMPSKLLSCAVFGTAYYGNNYDDAIAQYVDWMGLMTYDFTGSWNTSPVGPHTSLYRVPLNTYQGQTADNPILSAQDALEFWMGMAEPAWNHDGGFAVPKAKLCIGVPFYGYDLATRKPNNGNGYVTLKWKEIIAAYPNAATSFDPLDTRQLGGYINANGKKLYFETPKGASEKIKFTKSFGHQGVIIWELTGDAPYGSASSILKAINDAAGVSVNPAPTISITSPANNTTFAAGATVTINVLATDNGAVTKVEFFQGSAKLGEDLTSPYTFNWTGVALGTYHLTAKATDNLGAIATSSEIIITVGNSIPTVAISSPVNNAVFSAPTSVTINATANGSDGTINRVEFYVGNTFLGSDNTNPYSFNWANVPAGTYILIAKAFDNASAEGQSSPVNIIVSGNACNTKPWDVATVYVQNDEVSRSGNKYTAKWWTMGDDPLLKSGSDDVWKLLGPCSGGGNLNPTATITSPANNSSYTAPATVIMKADAIDSDGTISKVDFYNGTTLLGTDTTSPYSFSWTDVVAGMYSLVVKATDNVGGLGISSAITVTVGQTTGSCTGKPNYVENGGYASGSQVQNVGNLYECKPYPYTGWCNGAAWAYAPGTGSSWTDAWILKATCGNARQVTKTVLFDATDAATVSVWPNPALSGSSLTLKGDGRIGDVHVQWIDLQGVVVSSQYFLGTHDDINVNVPAIKSGVYIIKVESENKVWRLKGLICEF